MQRDHKLEQKENEARQKRCKYKAIYYGELVQLQHTMTKKYLAVSSSDTSLTENTKLKVRFQNNSVPYHVKNMRYGCNQLAMKN